MSGNDHAAHVRLAAQVCQIERCRVRLIHIDAIQRARPRDGRARRIEHCVRNVEADKRGVRKASRRIDEVSAGAAANFENRRPVVRPQLIEQAIAPNK